MPSDDLKDAIVAEVAAAWPDRPTTMSIVLAVADSAVKVARERLDAKDTETRTLADVLADIEKHDTDYDVRYGLVIEALHLALTAGYQAGIGIDHSEEVGFRTVAYIELPTGQISWHMPEHPKPWDGHTTSLKYRRIRWYIEDGQHA